MQTSKRGFTLIELSIVLVIIGLIVGGVFVGRELIVAAQRRQAVSDLEHLKTQIATFKLKYNCLPGDCANAAQFFAACTDDGGNTCNGDGNGFYDSDGTTINVYRYEGTLRVWEHLAEANLPFYGNYTGQGYGGSAWYNGGWAPGINTPKLPWGGVDTIGSPIGIYLVSGALCWWTNGCEGNQPAILANPLPQNTIVLAGIYPGNNMFLPTYGPASELGSYIDTKIDDGMPLSGIMHEYRPATSNQIGNPQTDCTDGTGNLTQPYAQNSHCVLLINLGL